MTSNMQETRQHLSTSRDSVVSLEIGQSRNEVMMELLLGAHNVSPQSLRERMGSARKRLAVSQKNWALLPPAGSDDPSFQQHDGCAKPSHRQQFATPISCSQSQSKVLRAPAGTNRPIPEPTWSTPVNPMVRTKDPCTTYLSLSYKKC